MSGYSDTFLIYGVIFLIFFWYIRILIEVSWEETLGDWEGGYDSLPLPSGWIGRWCTPPLHLRKDREVVYLLVPI